MYYRALNKPLITFGSRVVMSCICNEFKKNLKIEKKIRLRLLGTGVFKFISQIKSYHVTNIIVLTKITNL